jgi:hypothetical protein
VNSFLIEKFFTEHGTETLDFNMPKMRRTRRKKKRKRWRRKRPEIIYKN